MIVGGFWRCSIFGVFWTGKESATNPQKSDILAPKCKVPVFLGRPGGMRGATGEVRRGPNLSGFGRFWIGRTGIGRTGIGKKVRHAAPFLRKGRRKAQARIPPGRGIEGPLGDAIQPRGRYQINSFVSIRPSVTTNHILVWCFVWVAATVKNM